MASHFNQTCDFMQLPELDQMPVSETAMNGFLKLASPRVDAGLELTTASSSTIGEPDQEPGTTTTPTKFKPGRAKRTKYSDFPAFKEEDLPNPNTELNEKQISSLFCLPPKVRSRYQRYFSKAHGHIYASFRGLLFERLDNGKLRYPEFILRSNFPNWEKKLREYEMLAGSPISRPESIPVEAGPSASINLPVNVARPSTLPGYSTQPTEHNPCTNEEPLVKTQAPLNDLLTPLLRKLEIGDLDYLDPDDIVLLVEWTHQQCLKLQQHTSRALGIAMDTHYRHALLDVNESICRVSRSCFHFQAERRNDLEIEMGDGKIED